MHYRYELQHDRIYSFIFLGEIVQLSKNGVKSMCVVPRPDDVPSAFCIFEYVYFARADSFMEGKYGQKSTSMFTLEFTGFCYTIEYFYI